MDNKDNGMVTTIWGPYFWITLHFISFGYPSQPTKEKQQEYKNFFISLGDVLPCCFCRDSYKKFITEGNTKITDEIFKNRDSLVEWMYNIHQAVNNKLDVDYNISLDEIKERYESCRAKCIKDANGCIMPLDKKAISYRKIEQREAPVIPYEIVKYFVNYAKELKIDISFVYIYKNGITKDKLWEKRNKLCRSIIHKMRCAGLPTLDENGMPTKDELTLMMMFSTTSNKKNLLEIIKNKNLEPIKEENKDKEKFLEIKAKYIWWKKILKCI